MFHRLSKRLRTKNASLSTISHVTNAGSLLSFLSFVTTHLQKPRTETLTRKKRSDQLPLPMRKIYFRIEGQKGQFSKVFKIDGVQYHDDTTYFDMLVAFLRAYNVKNRENVGTDDVELVSLDGQRLLPTTKTTSEAEIMDVNVVKKERWAPPYSD